MTTRRQDTAAPKARQTPEPDPDDCPDVYASVARGRCLEPVYRDGTCLVFSKSEKPMPGDFVGIWLRQEAVPPGTPARRVKRLVLALPDIALQCRMHPASEIVPLVVVEQFNPPKTFAFEIPDVVAVHKVIGTATSNADGTARFVPDEKQEGARP